MGAPPEIRGRLLPIGDNVRIAIMGVILAAIVYFVVFHETKNDAVDVSPVIVETPNVPTLNADILKGIADSTRNERIPVEREPLAHLLEKSLLVVPAITKRLGMPDTPVPFDVLRADPQRFRGRYLWYKGELEALAEPTDGHPVRGYKIHEARIKTQDGEHVLFRFSVPPKDLAIGDWVRVEGYFLKLLDAHFPVPLSLAPLLVGPELQRAYPDWQAVETLDPGVLGALRDGVVENGMDTDLQDAPVRLPFAQTVPLWHLTSYATHQWLTLPPEQLAAAETFDQKEQWSAIYNGRMERGRAFKLFGIFLRAHVIAARPNPLGIEYWSEVWLLNRAFGARPFAVWLPYNVGEWKHSDTATTTGYFLKRYVVPGSTGEQHFSPVFVSARLERIDFSPTRTMRTVGLALGIGAGLLTAFLFLLNRRERKGSAQHMQEMSERRRRRRERRDKNLAPSS